MPNKISGKPQLKAPVKTLNETVLEEIQKKGMILEIKTTKILNENGFSVFNQVPYYDSVKNKIRTIDIKAEELKVKWSPKTETGKSIVKIEKKLSLFIECKKNESSKLIFFLKSHLDTKLELLNRRTKISTLNQLDTNYLYPNNAIGIIHQIVLGGDYFYGAQMQLLKSIEYTIGELNKKIELIVPIIVIEGDMFELYIENKEYKIRPIEFLQYISSGIPEDNTPVLIDVVNIKALQTYLEMVKKRFELFPNYPEDGDLFDLKISTMRPQK